MVNDEQKKVNNEQKKVNDEQKIFCTQNGKWRTKTSNKKIYLIKTEEKFWQYKKNYIGYKKNVNIYYYKVNNQGKHAIYLQLL